VGAGKKKKKKRRPGSAHGTSGLSSSLDRHTKLKGVTIMSWNPEHDNPDRADDRRDDAEQPANGSQPEQPGEETAADDSSVDAVHALNSLERLHDSNRDDFLRMAAVQEFGPQFREALNVLLTLSVDAVQTLAELTRMPTEQQALIRRALALPEEIQVALRGLLAE